MPKAKANLVISGPTDAEDGLLFWSNDLGWVDKASATRFTYDEIHGFITRGTMPIGAGPVHDERGEI